MTDYVTSWNLKQLGEIEMDNDLTNFVTETEKFIDKWKKDVRYLKDSGILLLALDEYENWTSKWTYGGKTAIYFWLLLELDQNNPDLKAKINKIEEVVKKYENKMRFFEHQLAQVSKKQQDIFLKDIQLLKYRHFLERLFAQAKYLLSQPEENILNLKDKPSRENWVAMTQALMSKELTGGKTMEELLSSMRDQDKSVRDGAARLFNQLLSKYEDLAEIEINSILEDKKVNDSLRKTSRADEMRHLGDDIESKIVDKMIEVVEKSNQVSNRFYKLKAELFGLTKLAYHERNISFGKIDKKYSFGEAVKTVNKVFESLDPGFGRILNDFVEKGLVDVYPKVGKKSGAFCAGFTRLLPTFILLNWTDNFKDVTTLAHEVGHGINNELMKEKQHSLSWGTPTSTAEVASTFFEDFVIESLAQKADNESKLSIWMAKLDNDIQSIWRQVACYKFERELHAKYRKKGYLSKLEIGDIFEKEMTAYMGSSVEQSEGSQNWWIYWGHIRRYFYVYSYASGQLISKSLQNSVRKDNGFIIKVKEFLTAGTSDSPKNIFLQLGIDIDDQSFWQRGVEEVENLLEETIGLAEKLGKIKAKAKP